MDTGDKGLMRLLAILSFIFFCTTIYFYGAAQGQREQIREMRSVVRYLQLPRADEGFQCGRGGCAPLRSGWRHARENRLTKLADCPYTDPDFGDGCAYYLAAMGYEPAPY